MIELRCRVPADVHDRWGLAELTCHGYLDGQCRQLFERLEEQLSKLNPDWSDYPLQRLTVRYDPPDGIELRVYSWAPQLEELPR